MNITSYRSLPNIKIMIHDDGVGCEPQDLQQGFGLLGIQTRVNSLGGKIEITTAKNRGMAITIHIPTDLQNKQKFLADNSL